MTLNEPYRVVRVPGGWRIVYPGLERASIWELYKAGTLFDLERRLLWGEANPRHIEFEVSDPEVLEIVARYSGHDLPTVVRRRLARIRAGLAPVSHGKGRLPIARSAWRMLAAEAFHEEEARALRGTRVDGLPASEAAWERTRLLFFPHMATARSVANLISKSRRDFFRRYQFR